MTTKTIRSNFIGLAAAGVLLALLASVSTVTAQPTLCPPAPCACGSATISVDPNLACGIELCETNVVPCITFGPGDHTVDCARLNRFRIRDCHGVLHCLPKPGTCLRCVCARTGCCVDICMESSAAECLILKVRP